MVALVLTSDYPSTRTNGYSSILVFNDTRLRRWTHLVLVYDHASMNIRFYADGNAVGDGKIDKHTPICIGSAWIGHWNNLDLRTADPMRNFRGSIDELAIFGRPLKSDEIQRMFEAGRPSGVPNTAVHFPDR